MTEAGKKQERGLTLGCNTPLVIAEVMRKEDMALSICFVFMHLDESPIKWLN